MLCCVFRFGLCVSLFLIVTIVSIALFLLPVFLSIYETCGNSAGNDEALECLGALKWVWEVSSKERTFDDKDDESQEWRKCFREKAATIHAEFLAFEKNHSYSRMVGDYAGTTDFDPSGHKWHQVPLQLWSTESAEAESFFPVTTECLHQSPLTTLLFSILDPWSEISPHTGVSYSILRYHLNLELPKYDPMKDRQLPLYGARRCGQKLHHVRGELEPGDTCFQAPVHLGVYDAENTRVKYYEWAEYGDLLFDDMHAHFVQNQTPERRVVMWGDVPRYDVPLSFRIFIQILHVLLPPFMPQVQGAIQHSENNLRRFGGLRPHFVRRLTGQSCATIGRFVTFFLLLSAFIHTALAKSVAKLRKQGLFTLKEL